MALNSLIYVCCMMIFFVYLELGNYKFNFKNIYIIPKAETACVSSLSLFLSIHNLLISLRNF